jgi:hypothetical protein
MEVCLLPSVGGGRVGVMFYTQERGSPLRPGKGSLAPHGARVLDTLPECYSEGPEVLRERREHSVTTLSSSARRRPVAPVIEARRGVSPSLLATDEASWSLVSSLILGYHHGEHARSTPGAAGVPDACGRPTKVRISRRRAVEAYADAPRPFAAPIPL